MNKKIFTIALILLSVMSGRSSGVERNVLDPLAEINRIKLEETLEDRLKDRLKSILQDEYVFVIVKVRLAGEEIIGTGSDEDGYALPGVPVERNLTDKSSDSSNAEPSISYKSRIANVYAWIFVSRDIPKESLEKAKELSSEILGIDLTRGDSLTIEAYLKEISLWEELQSSEVIVKLVAMGIILISFIIFLFGPLGVYLKKSTPLNQPIGGGSLAPAVNTSFAGSSPGAAALPAASSPSGALPGAYEKHMEDKGFYFVEEQSPADIAFILERATVEEAVIVLSNISSMQAGRIFSKLSAARQKDIIAAEKEVKFMDPEKVKKIEGLLKERASTIYGGSQKISKFLQSCSSDVKESMMDWLRDTDPAYATQVESSILNISDLVEYDNLSFRKIFRASGLESFAVAIKGMDEDLASKFKSKLNPDVVTLIDEQLKIIAPSPAKSSEAASQILENVLKLITKAEIEPLEGKELA